MSFSSLSLTLSLAPQITMLFDHYVDVHGARLAVPTNPDVLNVQQDPLGAVLGLAHFHRMQSG